MSRKVPMASGVIALLLASPAIARPVVPKERVLSSGWEMRLDAAAPAPPQDAPPDETAPDGQASSLRRTPAGRATQVNGPWRTPRGFGWLIRFESVRRNATVFLNGRRVGSNTDPYTPFTVAARRLRQGRR